VTTFNRGTLSRCTIYATRTTGLTLQAELDTPQPHDVDVKALLHLAVLYDVAIACNRSSADHIISSPLFTVPEKYRKDRGPNYAPWAR
jgi:methylglyoxal synthase